jgi:hypothetical protein
MNKLSPAIKQSAVRARIIFLPDSHNENRDARVNAG